LPNAVAIKKHKNYRHIMPSFGAENVSEIGLCMTGGAFADVLATKLCQCKNSFNENINKDDRQKLFIVNFLSSFYTMDNFYHLRGKGKST
jgi:hypothetical protein